MARGQTPAGGRRAANVTDAQSVIFHDLAEARAALADDPAMTLRTAPGAAAYAGVGYLMAVVEQSGADRKAAIIDCGEDAGTALAALRAGWKKILFSGRRDVRIKLAQIAKQQDAEVFDQ